MQWVVWSDEDGQCSNALAGGSTEQPVVQGQATYLFTSEVDQGGLVLCYKFGSEPYQAYPCVAIHSNTHTCSSSSSITLLPLSGFVD